MITSSFRPTGRGTTTRVPERYPLSLRYYRELIGCPPEKDVIWCYNTAQPGDFQGNLGFDLVAVFESFPNLAGIRFNDQFADEAFTVYDPPKVLIFKKSDTYNPAKVSALLSSVDLSKVVHLTPRQAGRYPGGMMLPRVFGDRRKSRLGINMTTRAGQAEKLAYRFSRPVLPLS